MALTIEQRLEQLRSRRRGTDEKSRLRLNELAFSELSQLSALTESWQRRAPTQPYTRYALGAMQAVAADYTQKSRDEATRVGKQLEDNLTGVETELQGSVPLDVHIRGVSDVDLLVLRTDFLVYDQSGVRASMYTPSPLDRIERLADLRSRAATHLTSAFPAVDVDVSGGKCIALSGGSLARPVDVVPALWWDTATYQATGRKPERGVTILNVKVPEALSNLPLLHIERIHNLDATYYGGLKMAVRLVKNVKNDTDNADGMKLPSFDIAALMYHADAQGLSACALNELYVLAETRRFLSWCATNPIAAGQFRTPDGLRAVLDTDGKRMAVKALADEFDNLAWRVAQEVGLIDPNATWDDVARILGDSFIPQAA